MRRLTPKRQICLIIKDPSQKDLNPVFLHYHPMLPIPVFVPSLEILLLSYTARTILHITQPYIDKYCHLFIFINFFKFSSIFVHTFFVNTFSPFSPNCLEVVSLPGQLANWRAFSTYETGPVTSQYMHARTLGTVCYSHTFHISALRPHLITSLTDQSFHSEWSSKFGHLF